ncbi:MAG: NPCBM/NEW2 domain-containing protein [Anaerolineae bacterium]|nr:NPCBM/NEW2 domain-containing protein [Phycisphaerae bacterium]
MFNRLSVFVCVLLSIAALSRAADVVWLDELNLAGATQEWGEVQARKSVDGNSLIVGGRMFERGVGTHANASMTVVLDHGVESFDAIVGVDDEKEKNGSAVFRVIADGTERFNSGKLGVNDQAKAVHVDLKDVRRVELLVDDANDGIDSDHANWCDAKFTLVPGAKARPRVIDPISRDLPKIASTAPRDKPEIHGPRVVGTTPGRPFLFQVPATGKSPLEFSADGLPEGLSIDRATGIITGSVKSPGESIVTLHVRNGSGDSKRKLKLVAGDHKLALTPPMGWNSWNVWGTSVDAAKIRAAADALVSSGLAAHGYSYINIDDAWEGSRDEQGNIRTNEKFGDMKALADYVHAKGLKLGIYSSPGPKTCAGFEGSFNHEEQDARTWASWEIDYLKYDWCSCTSKDHKAPYATMRAALDKIDRDIVYSFCQYGWSDVWTWGAGTGANLWRTTGDITDSWNSMSSIGFSQSRLAPFAGPGHWNDPDMLVVGHVGWGPKIRPTRLKPIEQQTHITLWAMLGAPLLIGCDLTKIDDFTRDLLCNDEVLDVNQDPLGQVARQIKVDGQIETWSRPLHDGTIAVAVFNRGIDEGKWMLSWSDVGLTGTQPIRDLWQHKKHGDSDGNLSGTISAHGSVMLKIGNPKE